LYHESGIEAMVLFDSVFMDCFNGYRDEYFDIFLGRMTMCSHAARIFDAKFSLNVNGQKVL